MKKILLNILSIILSFSMIGVNISSAAYISNNNITDGIILMNLKKNDLLTNEIFSKNSDGYFTKNNVNAITVYINSVSKK